MHARRKGFATISKHRMVSLIHPHSFSSMLSYALVTNVLPPKPSSSVVVSLKRLPFYRLRFRTFLLWLFPFVLLVVHTHETANTNYATMSFSCVLLCPLNLHITTLSLSEISLGLLLFMKIGARTSPWY